MITVGGAAYCLFLGVRDAHRLGGRDLEVVQRRLRRDRLLLLVELDERDVGAAGHQAHLLQAREPAIGRIRSSNQ